MMIDMGAWAITFRVALLICCLVVAGCGPSAETGAEDSELVIHRGNGGDPQTLDPAKAQDTHSFNVLTDLYEGLLGIDASGGIINAAAESWSVSDDGLLYRFELRDDARWSDGMAVEAAHFVAGLRRALSPATASAYGFLLNPVRNARRVESGELPPDELGVSAPDPKTLIIELEVRAPYFPSVLTMPIAFPYFGDTESNAGRFSDPEQFVGNGPFLLDEWHPGSHVRLRKNPTFREADMVAVDAVVFHAITEPVAELNMYRAGELDITTTVPGSHFRSVQASNTAELRLAPYLALYYIAFDVTEAPFDNASWENLPQAEREARARALYADAGYAGAAPLHVTLLYDAGDIHETIMLAVAGMWRDVLGVEVAFDKREWKYFLASRENRDDWQAMRFAWSGDYDHPATFTEILHSASPQNLPGYRNEVYDRLLARAAAATDPVEQMRLYGQAEAVILEDNPLIPLYFFVSKHLVGPDISGFEPNVLDRHPSRYLRKASSAQ
jgi:ABC-type oligopeptide transport system substrate-binding subunit